MDMDMESIIDQITLFCTENVVVYCYNIIVALVILFVGKWIVGRLSSWLKAVMRKQVDSTIANFIGDLARMALLAFIVIAALGRLGVETTSLVAIVGAAGLAVGLALKDSLGNFAAGVMIIIFRPFKVGDYVEAGGTAGIVREIKIFATIMDTGDNKVVIVSNNAIMGTNIVNYSANDTRRIDMVVSVSYSADLSKVKDVLERILGLDKRILKEPAPLVAVNELAESSVNLLVRPWVKTDDYWSVRWSVIEQIKQEFDQAGIEIPFPQMDVHVQQ